MCYDNNIWLKNGELKDYERRYTARLDFRKKWPLYVEGYKEAGDLLIKKCSPVNKNVLVYPICFMYRHYIEIQLKELIRLYEEFIIRNVSSLEGIPKNTNHHKLDTLWRDCKELLNKAVVVYGIEYQYSQNKLNYSKRKLIELMEKLEYQKTDLDFLEKEIEEFSKRDKSSCNFRYPINKTGDSSLPGLDSINLNKLSEAMNRISSLLNSYSAGIYGWLDGLDENK